MEVGETRVLEIPAALGYGSTGSPPTIPPNAKLVFLITLEGIS
jgi:FKBP-type peptidyl-prolyl cis-trans isomerase